MTPAPLLRTAQPRSPVPTMWTTPTPRGPLVNHIRPFLLLEAGPQNPGSRRVVAQSARSAEPATEPLPRSPELTFRRPVLRISPALFKRPWSPRAPHLAHLLSLEPSHAVPLPSSAVQNSCAATSTPPRYTSAPAKPRRHSAVPPVISTSRSSPSSARTAPGLRRISTQLRSSRRRNPSPPVFLQSN